MKTTIIRENDDCLVMTLKHVNRLGTPKLWAIAHENGHKTRERRVSGHISERCKVLTSHANPPRTQKLWAITHENG